MAALDPALVEFLNSGVVLGCASRDSRLVPRSAWPVGIRVEPGGEEVTVFLPVATAEDVLANLRDNRRIAVVATAPADHRSLQLKGQVLEQRPASDDDRSQIDLYRACLARTLEPHGVPRSSVLRIGHWPAHAVRFRVEHVFVQTPGPVAGQPFQAPFRPPEPVRS
ncbi:MAG TPA: hypothetical protein VFI53_03960 [Myxococcaceae bacterium]|nr:hypothetical protein [Myxococcaceae bacterium]